MVFKIFVYLNEAIVLDCKVDAHCHPTLCFGAISLSSTKREIPYTVSYIDITKHN